MKSILISIKPQWVEKILNGEKTIEIRKTMPKCELPCKVYIYCTKKEVLMNVFLDNKDKEVEYLSGKVVAEFTLNKVEIIPTVKEKRNGASYQYHIISKDILNKSCLNQEEILEYTNGKDLYAWHIDNIKIYDKPKQLNKLYKQGMKSYFNKLQKEYPNIDYSCYLENYKLQRPPQSWCYVEELED